MQELRSEAKEIRRDAVLRRPIATFHILSALGSHPKCLFFGRQSASSIRQVLLETKKEPGAFVVQAKWPSLGKDLRARLLGTSCHGLGCKAELGQCAYARKRFYIIRSNSIRKQFVN